MTENRKSRGSPAYRRKRALFNASRQFVAALAVLCAYGAAAAPVKILAIGDSLTAGFGLSPGDGFTAQLEAALKAKHVDAAIIDGGVSGETSAGGLATLDWQLADRPDYALVELGANDMLRGLPPVETRHNIEQILQRLKSAKIPALICGMRAAANYGTDYRRDFDAVFPALAQQFGDPLYPFFLDGVALQSNLLQADGLHPNAAGVKAIVERILPSVLQLIGGTG